MCVRVGDVSVPQVEELRAQRKRGETAEHDAGRAGSSKRSPSVSGNGRPSLAKVIGAGAGGGGGRGPSSRRVMEEVGVELVEAEPGEETRMSLSTLSWSE